MSGISNNSRPQETLTNKKQANRSTLFDASGNRHDRLNPFGVVDDSGSILGGIKFDAVSVAYPNNTTEVYSYYEGGLTGTLKATVTIVYNSPSKTEISSIVRA